MVAGDYVLALSEVSDVGGAERALLTLLGESPYTHCCLFAPSTGPLLQEAASRGIRVRTFDFENEGIPAQYGRPAVIIANRLSMAPVACRLGKNAGARVVVYVHDPPNKHDKRALVLRSWDTEWPVDIFICTTSRVLEGLSLLVSVGSRAAVIAPGIESCDCSDGENRSYESVLVLGRVHPSKRTSTVVDIAERLRLAVPEVGFLIVGGALFGQYDTYPDSIRFKIDQKGLGGVVSMVGFVSEGEKHDYLRTATVLLHASKSEPFGLAIAEAMGHGMPVVAAGSPGARMLVDDGKTGFLAESDATSLADAVSRFFSMPESERVSMGVYGRERISLLTEGTVSRAWEAVCRHEWG